MKNNRKRDVQCKYCGVVHCQMTITRYHNENCKLKGKILTEEDKATIEAKIAERWNSEHFQRVISDHDFAEQLVAEDPLLSTWTQFSFRDLPTSLKQDLHYKAKKRHKKYR